MRFYLKLFLLSYLLSFPFFFPSLKAATLTSKAVYTTGYWYMADYNNWGSNNTYNYGQAPLSTNGKAYFDIGNINTTYSGQAYQLAFGFQYNLTAQKYYDITFNFKNRDLTSNLTTSGVHLVSGVSSSTLYDTDHLSLIGLTNNATTGNNTNKLVVRIYAVQPITYWAIELNADPNNITSVNNFGISSITIDEVDTTNSQEIINNQTNNTQNIINNQNNTTQQIIDSQNELLGRKCENLLNKNNYIIDSDGYLGFSMSNLQVGKTYTLSSNQSFDYYKFSQKLFGSPEVSGPEGSVWSTSTTFTITDNSRYLFFEPTFNNWITNINQLSGYNLMLVEGSTAKPYCEFGSFSSKLDDTNNAINGLNNSINDDDVTDPTSFIDDMQDLLPTNGTITQLLTLPISLFQKVVTSINGTCQSFTLGNLYGTNLIMPCIDIGSYLGNTLWTTIDLIISGVFVLVIAKKMIKAFNSFTFMKEGDVIND